MIWSDFSEGSSNGPGDKIVGRDFLENVRRIHLEANDHCILTARYHVDRFDQAAFQLNRIRRPHCIAGSVATRQAEFLAGRMLVRVAQRVLAIAEGDVEIGPDRVPLWPVGTAGSISHASGYCGCLVLSHKLLSPGIDIEVVASGDSLDAISEITLVASEHIIIGALKQFSLATLSTLVFSSKETLFKALFPIVRTYFDFEHVEFIGMTAGGRIALRLVVALHETLPAGTCFEIHYLCFSEHVLTWLSVPFGGVRASVESLHGDV